MQALWRPGVNASKAVFRAGFPQPLLKLFGDRELRGFFVIYFQTGVFRIDGFMNIGFQNGAQPNDVSNIGESHLAPSLHIFRLRRQNTVRIL